MSNNMALEAVNLSKQFGSVCALNAINLQIPANSLTALVGPDGAGKTTFMRLVAGLLHPTSGSLQIMGLNTISKVKQIQQKISYMPQRFGLYEDLSVQENLNLYADLHGVSHQVRSLRIRKMLEMIDMTRFTQRLAGNLSGGMKQKLALACVLVRSPDLLLLDEPTVGVDPLSRRELWKIIDELIASENFSAIVSTAYMDEASHCPHVVVLNQGHIIAEGAPYKLALQAQDLCYSVVPGANMSARVLQAKLLDADDLIIDAVPYGGKVRFIRKVQTTQEQLSNLLENLPYKSQQAELEDGIQTLLKEQNSNAKLKISTPKYTSISADVVIEVKNLVRKFGDFVAVDDTSFVVKKGEIFGLLGPNGAGKTTTFRMLCGLLPATSGYLSVVGLNLRNARSKARQKIGYVAQKFALYGNLSVLENLTFFGGAYGLYGDNLQNRLQTIMAEFDLLSVIKHKSGDLSGGFKQRLAMAAALLHKPEILFLDEPTSGIDPGARRLFWRRITDLAANGTTIIVTTHFMEEAEYCDRIMIQDGGKLLALGTPEQVRTKAGQADDMNNAFIKIVELARQNL